MVNFNGNILPADSFFLNQRNRGLRYGDALSESLRAIGGKLVFWEDHYLKLMASMRILRMEIPMEFTMDFLENQILITLRENGLNNTAALVDIVIFRDANGSIFPESNKVAFLMEVNKLDSSKYCLANNPYEVELFKDFYVSGDMLSTLKTNNNLLQVTASIFAKENGYADCLLLNHNKMVVGSLIGNLFLIVGDLVKTAPVADGCKNSVIREKIIKVINDSDDFKLEKKSISPFELQKADELFVVDIGQGLTPISKYRKKKYASENSKKILEKINEIARTEI